MVEVPVRRRPGKKVKKSVTRVGAEPTPGSKRDRTETKKKGGKHVANEKVNTKIGSVSRATC